MAAGFTNTAVLDKFGLDPKTMPMKPMSVEQCVSEGLSGLRKNRSRIIPGRLNRIMNALVPASLARKLEADLIGKGLARKSASAVGGCRVSSIMKLTSNTVLITGGASGIGYELTKQLTALGNTILVTGRDQAKMDRAKRPFQISTPFEATFPIRKRSPLFTKRSPNSFLSSTC